MEVLKEEADAFEKAWKERKEQDVHKWKDKTQKHHEHWQHHLEHQQDMRKLHSEKHAHDLLHSHSPTFSHGGYRRNHSISSRGTSKASSVDNWNTAGKSTPPAVRFMPTPIIHIFEEPLLEEKDEDMVADEGMVAAEDMVVEEDMVASKDETHGTASSGSVEEIIDLSATGNSQDEVVSNDDTPALKTGKKSSCTEVFASEAVGSDTTLTNDTTSVLSLASSLVEEAIKGAMERVGTPLNKEDTSPSGDHDKDESAGISRQVTVESFASSVVEEAIREVMEQVGTPPKACDQDKESLDTMSVTGGIGHEVTVESLASSVVEEAIKEVLEQVSTPPPEVRI